MARRRTLRFNDNTRFDDDDHTVRRTPKDRESPVSIRLRPQTLPRLAILSNLYHLEAADMIESAIYALYIMVEQKKRIAPTKKTRKRGTLQSLDSTLQRVAEEYGVKYDPKE